MGLDSNGLKFLLYARKLGADFGSTAMIGRQFILATPEEMRQLLHAGEPLFSVEEVRQLIGEHEGYSEWLFKAFGAVTAESFDSSSYEGATQIHDFNFPIPAQFKRSYSVVFDGGTLEHVFNYPIALQNCMEMVCQGGHFLAITPANNFPGHGFYQFSPELFFRVFSNENGFEIVDLIFIEDHPNAPWYRLKDPATIGRRVTFENVRPAYLFVIARRTSLRPVFERFPQQSDYATLWENADMEIEVKSEGRGAIYKFPDAVKRRLRRLLRPHAIRFRPDDFTQFDPFDELTSSRRTP